MTADSTSLDFVSKACKLPFFFFELSISLVPNDFLAATDFEELKDHSSMLSARE